LREVITREFRPVTTPLQDVVGWELEHVRVRPGFRELVELAERHGWRVAIVSSGFHELIEPILEREGVQVEVHANGLDPRLDGWIVDWRYSESCDSCGESCKRSIVQEFADDDELVYIAARPRSPTASSQPGGLRPIWTNGGFPTSASTTSTTSLAVSLPEPFDFELSTERYRAFGPDLANLWHEGGLHRVFGGREVRIEPAPGGVRIQPGEKTLVEPVRRYLGGPFDLDAFAAFAVTDSVLARIVERLPGLRPPLSPDPWETLVTSITAQQVSLYAAFAIRNRFIEAFGRPLARAYAFPTRQRLADARLQDLTPLGFSRRKAEYVLALARSGLDLDGLALLADEEVKALLVALPGIGEWTADWFLARHLARPDAWPAGDLGLRKAVLHFYGEEDTRAAGDRFPGHRNLAAHYLLVGLRVLA
jgi:3-methyladenine DNA glycosylase/8-oxoguanine DNA glycosylase